MKRGTRASRIGAALVVALTAMSACSEPAREELSRVADALNRAGEALDAAIRQSARDVEPHAEEAGREMKESLRDAIDELKASGAAVHGAAESAGEDGIKADAHAVTCMGESYAIERDLAERVAASPTALAAEATVEQTDDGYRIQSLAQDGVLARLGVREGDVIVAVDGLNLDPPLVRPLEERMQGDEIGLTIDRAGQRIRKTIVIGRPAQG